MDLERHLAVLWRRRAILIGGLVLAVVTAFLAAYQPGPGGLERRGTEVWSSSSMIMVTQKGFPWGRVTLPGQQATPGAALEPGTDVPVDPSEGIPFADPGRFSALALVYSVMSYSDRVRAMLPGRPSADQIAATPFDPTGRGDQMLPIIQVTTKATSARGAFKLNGQTVAALGRVILRKQRVNDIPRRDRVQLDVLKRPDPPVLVQGRSWTSSILAFFLCVGAALILAHLLEGLAMASGRRGRGDPGPPSVALGGNVDLGAERETGAFANGRPREHVVAREAGTHVSRLSGHWDRLRDG